MGWKEGRRRGGLSPGGGAEMVQQGLPPNSNLPPGPGSPTWAPMNSPILIILCETILLDHILWELYKLFVGYTNVCIWFLLPYYFNKSFNVLPFNAFHLQCSKFILRNLSLNTAWQTTYSRQIQVAWGLFSQGICLVVLASCFLTSCCHPKLKMAFSLTL